MNIARVLYPINVLGPGSRIGIWTCGCRHCCPHCSNPELWEPRPEYEITAQELARVIQENIQERPIDGFVITGGDPMYQAKELSTLLPELRRLSDDILVYTGFTYEELISSELPEVRDCLSQISVLIDGPYYDELNDGCLLRGSNNQRIIYLDQRIRAKYEHYLNEIKENRIQNFTVDDGIVSVGIHRRGFSEAVAQAAREKGVIIDG